MHHGMQFLQQDGQVTWKDLHLYIRQCSVEGVKYKCLNGGCAAHDNTMKQLSFLTLFDKWSSKFKQETNKVAVKPDIFYPFAVKPDIFYPSSVKKLSVQKKTFYPAVLVHINSNMENVKQNPFYASVSSSRWQFRKSWNSWRHASQQRFCLTLSIVVKHWQKKKASITKQKKCAQHVCVCVCVRACVHVCTHVCALLWNLLNHKRTLQTGDVSGSHEQICHFQTTNLQYPVLAKTCYITS